MLLSDTLLMAKVTKAVPQPKRTIDQAEDDHPLGLWIDRELLRKHTRHQAKPILDTMNYSGNRYLELADIALGLKRPERHPVNGSTSEPKSPHPRKKGKSAGSKG